MVASHPQYKDAESTKMQMNRDATEVPPAWEQLITWVAVVETGSVSAAASRLGVSQASVSQHVRQLETLYGTELLDRSTRPGKPTSAGQRLLEHATQLLGLADEMAHGVRSFSGSKRPVVRIGCVDSFAATIGPQLVRALSDRVHKVRLFSGLSPALIGQFNNRQMDLLISAGDIGNTALVNRRVLLSEYYCVVVPTDHDVRALTTLAGLAQQLQFMHYSARSVMGTQIASYLQATDPAIERAFEFDATDPMLALVAAGLGFAITTPLCLWQARHYAGQVKVLPLSAFTCNGKPYPPLARTLYLASQEGELGKLPDDIQDIVRVAGRVLKREIVAVLKLDNAAISIEGDL